MSIHADGDKVRLSLAEIQDTYGGRVVRTLPTADLRWQPGLAYIGRGWPVFVLSPSKAPLANCPACQPPAHNTPALKEACRCLKCHGFYAATTGPQTFALMLAGEPRGLLAIRTGAVSGLVVIDVDPRHSGLATAAGLKAAGLLPPTVTQRSGGGGGHFLYAHPGGRVTSGSGKGGPGIDVKGDDAYIVAAPSVHPRTGAAYRWVRAGPVAPLPAWWRERLAARPTPPAPGRPVTAAGARARLAGLVGAVLRAPAGEHHDVLHWAARRVADMAAGGQADPATAGTALVLAVIEAGSEKWTEAEAWRVVRSAGVQA